MPRLTLPLFHRLAWLGVCGGISAGTAADPEIVMPRLLHPGAAQTFYFVLTDRFANGSSDNDTGGYPGGPEEHGFDPTRISHYHGGDLAGLTQQLDYLEALGVTAIWLTPPFKNKPVQSGTAGYHGYWITDFLQIDPHLGTNEELAAFVETAHQRGLRVYLDIIVNHTADVITPAGNDTRYRDTAGWPFRDATGEPFDVRAVAFNGLGPADVFPALSAERSFAHPPMVRPAEADVKRPAWLNDVTLYHNRGNSRFTAEDALYGDFVGLDDLFTEHPTVVHGFIEIYRQWVKAGIDGFRIDTAKHVNPEFWQAFAPAIRDQARREGRSDFFAFGEVYSGAGDARYLSEFSTVATLDAPIDFGFFVAARDYISRRGSGAALAEFFATDDYYTDHDSTADAMPTFLGNHDAGRFAHFVQQDNPDADAAEVLARVALGHGLLFLVRGQPVVYYGDEQGMVGIGHDMGARESMFGARAAPFRDLPLLGTTRTGRDDKFDQKHPLYQLISRLARLRAEHPALARGTMYPRVGDDPRVFAVSRIGRSEGVEYLAAFNHSATEAVAATLPTSQRPGRRLGRIFASPAGGAAPSGLVVDERGQVRVNLAPLQFAVWRANTRLGAPPTPVGIRLMVPEPDRHLIFHPEPPVDGQVFSSRQEIRAEVAGGDGVGEVTFGLSRSSRPDQWEWLGTDAVAPYRVFWRPPADLAPDETFSLIATVSDLRDGRASTTIGGLTAETTGMTAGIRGSTVPHLLRQPPARMVRSDPQLSVELAAEATGTAPLVYQWFRDDEQVPGAEGPALTVTQSGRYRLLVRNLAGTVLSRDIVVE